MARIWKTPQNYRSAPSLVANEQLVIEGGYALLAEAPADPGNPATPMAVRVNGVARTRVTGAPAAGQYRVVGQTVINSQGQPKTEYLPLVQFHSSDEGQPCVADYYRVGTVLTGEFFDLLKWFLTPITGVATLSDLQTQYPATTDITKRGRPGDQCYLSSGVAYFSDGLQWRQFSATQPNNWAESIQMLGRYGVTFTSAFAAAWTASQAFAAAHGFYVTNSYIASGTVGALTVAAALGVSSSSSFVAAWAKSQGYATGHTFSSLSDYAAGGGTTLVPANPNFDIDITALAETSGAWWKDSVDVVGENEAGRYASTSMTGSYVGRIFAAAFFDGEGFNPRSTGLVYKFTRADIDAKDGVLTFDLRCVSNPATSLGFFCSVRPYDSLGSPLIVLDTTHKNVLEIGSTMGSAADKTTIKVASPASNTNYLGKTFNLKTWIEGRLVAGKTWADVDRVLFSFVAHESNGTPLEWYVDNFR